MSLLLLLSLLSAFFVFYSKNSVFSILSLIVLFICLSVLLVFIELEFLPLIMIMIYVGAVTILFLFVVMMLNIKKIFLKIKSNSNSIKFGSIAVIYLFFNYYVAISYLNTNCDLFFNGINLNWLNVEIIDNELLKLHALLAVENLFSNKEHLIFYAMQIAHENIFSYINDLKVIGFWFYTNFFPFLLVAGFVLLQSILGAIVLTMPYHRKLSNMKAPLSSSFLRSSRKNIVLLKAKQ